VLALALPALLAAGTEAVLRARGYAPEPMEEGRLWALAREAVRPHDPGEVVVLGSSRIQCGLQLDAWSEVTGRKPVQLAIYGSSPVPVLEDLATDESFTGTAIVEVTAPIFFSQSSRRLERPRRWIAQWREMRQSLFGFAERRLELAFEERAVFLGRAFDLPNLAAALAEGRWPVVSHRFRGDRNRTVIPDHITEASDLAAFEPGGGGDGADRAPPDAGPVIERVTAAVERLEKRGGRAVLVALPARGSVALEERRLTPRSRYWDVLVSALDVPAIHWEDEPELRELRPADSMHLPGEQAELWTRSVARMVRDLGS
jgi:hypothetical protein